jgi:hypothetical protein
MGTIEAHTELKGPEQMGAKLLNLVPGAGLEPARTLPGPRDFKSRIYYLQQTLTVERHCINGVL